MFEHTTLAQGLSPLQQSRDLVVTHDFMRTVKLDQNCGSSEWFMRPVKWIVRSLQDDNRPIVIMSPFEADGLFQQIRKSHVVQLCVYTPRITISGRSVEDLTFCCLPGPPRPPAPSMLVGKLNLFAGQTWITSLEAYQSLCRYLGLAIPGTKRPHTASFDGFVRANERAEYDPVMAQNCLFSENPLSSIKELISLRQRGHPFIRSHLGRIIEGLDLLPCEWDTPTSRS